MITKERIAELRSDYQKMAVMSVRRPCIDIQVHAALLDAAEEAITLREVVEVINKETHPVRQTPGMASRIYWKTEEALHPEAFGVEP